jgi:hypothetical protein
MPTQSIISTTLQLLRDKLVDNSYLAHPLIRSIEEHGNLVKVAGGQRIDQPVIFGETTSITELSTGWEAVNMAVRDPFHTATFDWANFTQPIIINAVEKAANKGDLAVVSILESKMKNVMLSLKKEVSKQIIRGDSSVLGSLETLNGMGTAASAVDTTGWFQSAAFGLQATNTVGGLSKGTFAAQNWQNQVFNSSGTLALSHLDELMIQCQIFNPSGAFPDILLMSPSCYSAFMALQQSAVRYVSRGDQKSLDADMVGEWRGARIYIEPQLGFNNAAGTPVSAYALSSDQFQLYADTDGFFNVSEMLPVPGTASEAAMVFNRMQLVTGHLASHGVLLNAEA